MRLFFRKPASWSAKLLLSLALVTSLTGGVAAKGDRDVVNLINFIRGVEPRSAIDLLEPVREQLALAKKHDLPTTWLIQYDALIKPEFTDLLKREMGPEDEIGAWLEVVQPQAEAAGIPWRGRYPWDWHVNVGFTQGYEVAERKKLMDVYMAKFAEVFGRTPKSVGCWVIDAPTLNYLHDRYGIEAACNCKDQSGTDGYTLWGGYWNQAYYPSRLNAYMPAQGAERQLDVPVFRMLGSDPVHQYDQGIGSSWQGVVTLEPIYRPGGGDPGWVDWFFDTNFDQPSLGFSYMQAGQENSFGWPAMSEGLIDQYAKLAKRRNRGDIVVETLGESARWFRRTYPRTPATSVVALEDSTGAPKRSIWYESRCYRVNFYWDKDRWKIRDLHLFNEDYPERYLDARAEDIVAHYDTLPLLDGFHWSVPDDLASFSAVAEGEPVRTKGVPKVTGEGADTLQIECGLKGGGKLVILCEPESLRIDLKGLGAPDRWAMELAWSAEKQVPVSEVSPHAIGYRHQGFTYQLRCGESAVSRVGDQPRIKVADHRGTIRFDFRPQPRKPDENTRNLPTSRAGGDDAGASRLPAGAGAVR
ncbi:hypothetical protein [Haloferula sargassicola]|uniref:Uncharacterized protein n=1 Tax=Haloferula sargassicola TaxID=490096 RepID=A0ABP9UTD2_9BACT